MLLLRFMLMHRIKSYFQIPVSPVTLFPWTDFGKVIGIRSPPPPLLDCRENKIPDDREESRAICWNYLYYSLIYLNGQLIKFFNEPRIRSPLEFTWRRRMEGGMGWDGMGRAFQLESERGCHNY